MSLSHKNYPYKWFGVWKEYGTAYSHLPSVENFVNETLNSSYRMKELLFYLENCQSLEVSSKMAFPSPLSGKTYLGALSVRTDGHYLWWDSIVDLIKDEGLVLPDSWYERISSGGFVVPPKLSLKSLSLERPPGL